MMAFGVAIFRSDANVNNGMRRRRRREAVFSAYNQQSARSLSARQPSDRQPSARQPFRQPLWDFEHEEDDDLEIRHRSRRDDDNDDDDDDGDFLGPEDVRGIGENGRGTNLHALNLNTSRPSGARGRAPETGERWRKQTGDKKGTEKRSTCIESQHDRTKCRKGK